MIMKNSIVLVLMLLFQASLYSQQPNVNEGKTFIADFIVAEYRKPFEVDKHSNIRLSGVNWDQWCEDCEGKITSKGTFHSVFGSLVQTIHSVEQKFVT